MSEPTAEAGAEPTDDTTESVVVDTRRRDLRGRRFHDELPDERSRRGDYQHHVWPRRHCHKRGLTDIRNLPCLGTAEVDSMVHALFHLYWDPPNLRDPRVVAVIRELGERHDYQLCSCFEGSGVQRILVDALSMRPLENEADLDFDLLPECLIWEIDPAAHAFLRRFVKRNGGVRMGTPIRAHLRREHQEGRCVCYFEREPSPSEMRVAERAAEQAERKERLRLILASQSE